MKTVRRSLFALLLAVGAGACNSSIMDPHTPDPGHHTPDPGAHTPDPGH